MGLLELVIMFGGVFGIAGIITGISAIFIMRKR